MHDLIVRSLVSEDFAALGQLEADIFGAVGDSVLCPQYLRLCTEFYRETCFLALADGRPVGYLLCVVRGREAYCARLGIRTEFQRTKVTTLLLAAFVTTVVEQADTCWFTVKPDNVQARALHKMLGAIPTGVVRDFFTPGDERILAKIDRPQFEKLRPKYERLGLLTDLTRKPAHVEMRRTAAVPDDPPIS
jgi:ribosomal protein S18 acetylase RimI-like enzyme